jgi:hypothetical protein
MAEASDIRGGAEIFAAHERLGTTRVRHSSQKKLRWAGRELTKRYSPATTVIDGAKGLVCPAPVSRVCSNPAGRLFFEPHPRPAIADVAGVQKNHTGSVAGPLNRVQGGAARIHDAALGIFDRDLGDAGSGGELALFPAEESAGCAYLFSRNHRYKIGHNGRF